MSYYNHNNLNKGDNNMTSKTHYREVSKSPCLHSMDLDKPENLTISHVVRVQDPTKRSKDMFNVAFFKEKKLSNNLKLKPMILNSGNSSTLKNLAGGSKYIEDWLNVFVTIYVQDGVRNPNGGEKTSGLRISPNAPKKQSDKKYLNPENKAAWNKAVKMQAEGKGLDIVKRAMNLTAENESKIIQEANLINKNQGDLN